MASSPPPPSSASPKKPRKKARGSRARGKEKTSARVTSDKTVQKGKAPPKTRPVINLSTVGRFLLRVFRVLLLAGLLAAAALPILQVWLLNFINPPLTLTMVEQTWTSWDETGQFNLPRYRWVKLEDVPEHVVRAAVSSEDARFFDHNGFDWDAIEQAVEEHIEGGSRAGGSTISQQTAKNVFLWQDRSWIRKGMEVWYTFWLEKLVDKHRILEVYLNVAETGPLTFGVRAGAQRWYNKDISRTSPDESARLICIFPSPRQWTPTSAHVVRRARRIQRAPAPIPEDWRER